MLTKLPMRSVLPLHIHYKTHFFKLVLFSSSITVEIFVIYEAISFFLISKNKNILV